MNLKVSDFEPSSENIFSKATLEDDAGVLEFLWKYFGINESVCFSFERYSLIRILIKFLFGQASGLSPCSIFRVTMPKPTSLNFWSIAVEVVRP